MQLTRNARRLVSAVAVATVLTTGAATPAHAAAPGPTPDMLSAATLARLNALVAAAPDPTNFIFNESESPVALGVIHLRDNDYTYGTHDTTIRPGTSTLALWSTTAGWYTGPGYCTQQYRSDYGSNSFHRQTPDLPAGTHYIGAFTTYAVYVYKKRTANAC